MAANPFAVASDLQWTGFGGNAFRGAEYNRLSADRMGTANHPDTEVRYASRALRGRARDLVRNNPYAAGVVEAFADNIIGEHGIRLVPNITNPPNDPRGTPLRELNWELERGWAEWGSEYASVDGFESWLETSRMIAKSWPTDGEVFLRRRKGWDNPYGFACELIDPDLLDEQYNVPARTEGQNEIVQGVELDRFGRRVAYHFWDRHPDESRKKRVPIPAGEITHFFDRYRTGQTRGFSKFAPVLTTVEMIDGYTEAELVASRMHAAKMGFITNNDPIAVQLYAQRFSMQAKGEATAPARMKAQPGVIPELMPGQGFESFDPTHPNSAFDGFLSVMLRGVARGLGISHFTLTGDTANANYSSQRIALVPERDRWKALQAILAAKVHTPVYRDLLASGLLTGAFRLPSPVAERYHSVQWRPRRWQWIDPVAELDAAETEIHLGINSRQRLAADRGLDFEVIIDESAQDQKYAEKNDVWIGGAGGTERVKVESEPPGGAQPGKPAPGKNGKNGKGQEAAHRLAPFTAETPHGD